MDKAYLITAGQYSDYTVLAVFTDLAKAQAFHDCYPTTGYSCLNDIEFVPLNEKAPLPPGMKRYSVRIGINGDVVGIVGVSPSGSDIVHAQPYGDNATMEISCTASSEEHAAKIANEHRAMLVATDQWTHDWAQWYAREK